MPIPPRKMGRFFGKSFLFSGCVRFSLSKSLFSRRSLGRIKDNPQSIRRVGWSRRATVMDNAHAFSAIRGIQGGREYYVVMVPLKVVAKIFLFDDAELPADLRAQRILNRGRIPDI